MSFSAIKTNSYQPVSDSGRVIMSTKAELIEIIETMDPWTIEHTYPMIARIDSTILNGVPSINPVSPGSKPYFTSFFGRRLHPISGKITLHKGVDITTSQSFQYIHSTAEGVVNSVSFSKSAGIYISIDHLAGFSTTYMHLSGAEVSPGDSLKIGQVIGWMGATGRVTAKHVHYEVKKKSRVVDPLPYLDLYLRCRRSLSLESKR